MGLTAEQRAARATTIGASDIPKLAKLTRFGGPLSVFNEKVNGFDFGAENEAADIGHEAEDLIARLYTKRTGIALAKPAGTLTHAKYAWATCTPDRLEAVTTIPVELKNVGYHMSREWNEHDEEGVPDDYRAQVLWQVEILRSHGERIDSGRIAALLGGNKFRAFRVAWDPEFVEDLLAIGYAFVEKHLRPKVAPPLEGNEQIAAWLKKTYPLHSDEIADAPIEALAWAEELHQIRTELDTLIDRKDELDTLFKGVIADRLGISGPWGEATWGSRNGATKWKAVAEGLLRELPPLVASGLRDHPVMQVEADAIRAKVRELFEGLQIENKSEGGRTFLFKYDDGTKPAAAKSKSKKKK